MTVSILKADERAASLSEAAHSAARTIEIETEGLVALQTALRAELGSGLDAAVRALAGRKGRIIVTGIGKSGHIGQKIAATFASTGTPAFFVHPSEASHGDLGMITQEDGILALSWSGETAELSNILNYAVRFAVPLIAITAAPESTLGKAADIVLALPKAKEACPHGLAPTTSTLLQLALGDCLAIALLEAKGFSPNDFRLLHPGGQLGAKLKFVSDIMHGPERLPLAPPETPMIEAIVTMTKASFGCLGVVDKGKLVGIVTDGDLRRHMPTIMQKTAGDIMTRRPKTAPPDMLASAALELINAKRITAIFVVDDGKPVGIVHVHDLLRLGVA